LLMLLFHNKRKINFLKSMIKECRNEKKSLQSTMDILESTLHIGYWRWLPDHNYAQISHGLKHLLKLDDTLHSDIDLIRSKMLGEEFPSLDILYETTDPLVLEHQMVTEGGDVIHVRHTIILNYEDNIRTDIIGLIQVV